MENNQVLKEVYNRMRIIDNSQVKLSDFVSFVINIENIKKIDIITAYFWYESLDLILPLIKEKGIKLNIVMGPQTSSKTKDILLIALGLKEDEGKYTNPSEKLFISMVKNGEIGLRTSAGVKSLPKIHSKIYLFYNDEGPALGLNGSTNLTGSGMLKAWEATVVVSKGQIPGLKDQFEYLWDECKEGNFENMGKNIDFPDEPDNDSIIIDRKVLLSYLFWLFGEKAISDKHITSFQAVDVYNLKRSMEEYGGGILASSVGTGKSHVLKSIAQEFINEKRGNVLLIAPKAIIGTKSNDSQWESIFVDKDEKIDKKKIELVISSTQNIKIDETPKIYLMSSGLIQNKKDLTENQNFYGFLKNILSKHEEFLVIIDEAHHFRNKETNRFRNIKTLLNDAESKSKGNVITSTATPINTRLDDLLTMIFLSVRELRNLERDDPNLINSKIGKIRDMGGEIVYLLNSYLRLKDMSSKREQGKEEFLKFIKAITQKSEDEPVKSYNYISERLMTKSNWSEVFSDKASIAKLIKLKEDEIPDWVNKDLFSGLIDVKPMPYFFEAKLKKLYENLEKQVANINYVPYAFSNESTLDKTIEGYADNRFRFNEVNKNIYKADSGGNSIYATTSNGKVNYVFDMGSISNLYGQYKILLVKRGESSIFSFLVTLMRLMLRYKILEGIDDNNGPDEIKKKLSENYGDQIKIINEIKKDSKIYDEMEGEEYKSIDNFIDTEYEKINEYRDFIIQIMNDASIREKFDEDVQIIEGLLNQTWSCFNDIWDGDGLDQKVEKFVEIIKGSDNEKSLTFTSFVDTLKYVQAYIEKKHVGLDKVEYYSAEEEKAMKYTLDITKSFNESDEINHIFSTDVLSEGVNLGEGKIFINYDVEFNPVRVIQRSGRITRLDWFGKKIKDMVENHNDDLDLLRKKIYLIQPESDSIINAITNIVGRYEDRFELILSLVGVDVVLMDPEKVKELIAEVGKHEENKSKARRKIAESLQYFSSDSATKQGITHSDRVETALDKLKIQSKTDEEVEYINNKDSEAVRRVLLASGFLKNESEGYNLVENIDKIILSSKDSSYLLVGEIVKSDNAVNENDEIVFKLCLSGHQTSEKRYSFSEIGKKLWAVSNIGKVYFKGESIANAPGSYDEIVCENLEKIEINV